MRPAAALLWQLAHRHRWGFAAIGLYIIGLAVVRVFILPHGFINPLESMRFAFTVNVPFAMAFIYLLAIFSFGLEGDLAARPSLYPARMFTLPVSSTALAGWPLCFGALTAAALWLLVNLLALRPAGIVFPLAWPALFAAGLVAWTQALMWLPYPLRHLRVLIAVLLLFTIDTVVILAVYVRTPASVLTLATLPLTPLAFLVARRAVAMARRGDVPEWRLQLVRGRETNDALASFDSPFEAQLWFEWQRHGRSLPRLVAILVTFQLALLFTPGADTPEAVFEVLALAVLTPPVMAMFAAATVRRIGTENQSHGLDAFTATRPLASSSMVAATLRCALRSTLLSWLIVFLAIPLALSLSRDWEPFLAGVRSFLAALRPAHAVVVATVVLLGLAGSTWKQLVQSLCIGFTGRERWVKASVFTTLVLLVGALVLYSWISESEAAQDALWRALRWLPAVLVAVKMGFALPLAARLYDSRVLSARLLTMGATTWCAAVLLIYGALTWAVHAPQIPQYLLILLAILLTPLNRLAAAPLALSWNRHR